MLDTLCWATTANQDATCSLSYEMQFPTIVLLLLLIRNEYWQGRIWIQYKEEAVAVPITDCANIEHFYCSAAGALLTSILFSLSSTNFSSSFGFSSVRRRFAILSPLACSSAGWRWGQTNCVFAAVWFAGQACNCNLPTSLHLLFNQWSTLWCDLKINFSSVLTRFRTRWLMSVTGTSLTADCKNESALISFLQTEETCFKIEGSLVEHHCWNQRSQNQ